MLDSKIHTFLEVVRQKSYTQAGRVLHMTQPAVSQHIKKLEGHYGCALFCKNSKSPTLTAKGKKIYDYSKLQVASEKQMLEALRSEDLTLRIGATLSIADYYLPAYLNAYMANAKVDLSVTVKNTRALLDQLLEGSLHCAFIEGDFDPDLFEAHGFESTNFVAVARAGHPLSQGVVDLQACFDYPLILREEGSGTRGILEAYLRHYTYTMDRFCKIDEVSSFMMMKTFLKHSDKISFMYEGVCRQEIADKTLTQISIKDFALSRRLHFIFPINSTLKEPYMAFFNKLIAYKKGGL